MISLSLYNAFDIIGYNEKPVPHPFRYALNIHFYNLALVAEKTTAHLTDKGGVFNQIFALSHTGLTNFLDHFYFNQMEFGREANLLQQYENLTGDDIQYKSSHLDEDLLLKLKHNIPEHSQLSWQIDYKVIFLRYAKKIVKICWPNGQTDLSADEKNEKVLS
jgi:hypothetical protein